MYPARQTGQMAHEVATAFLMGLALFALTASWWLWVGR
jgi:hypothetical protein